MKIGFHYILITLVMLALVACGLPGDSGNTNGSGGSDSSAGSAGAGPSVTGGGVGGTGTGASIIGGTGTGVITDFGNEITLNDIRKFAINADTIISIDGREIGETGLRGAGLGVVANIIAEADVDVNFTIGTAMAIQARHLVIGPVTGMEPLHVLGQSVLVTSDTVLPGGLDPEYLAVGDIVRVSGYAGSANAIQATRLELAPPEVSSWVLVGPVSRLSESGLYIGRQPISLTGVTSSGCGGGIDEGDLVRVYAAPDADIVAGPVNPSRDDYNSYANSMAALDTVTDVACIPCGPQFADTPAESELVAQAEGLVMAVDLPRFTIQGQRVVVTADTIWLGGRGEDVMLNARIEAQGLLHMESGVLTAGIVTFRHNRARIEAPLTKNDTDELQVLGMNVLATPFTEDDDKILSGGRINVQVEMRGFEDDQGQIFATRIIDKGKSDGGDVRLRGRVTGVINPVIQVLGLNVDTTGMTLLGAVDEIIGPLDFFRLVQKGSEVEVLHGVYDGVNGISSSFGETTARILP